MKQIDQKIVELIEKGNTYRQIAEQLEVSLRDIPSCVQIKQKQKRIADYRMEQAVLDYKK